MRERRARRTQLYGDRGHLSQGVRRLCPRLPRAPQESTVARCPVDGGPSLTLPVFAGRTAEEVDSSSLLRWRPEGRRGRRRRRRWSSRGWNSAGGARGAPLTPAGEQDALFQGLVLIVREEEEEEEEEKKAPEVWETISSSLSGLLGSTVDT